MADQITEDRSLEEIADQVLDRSKHPTLPTLPKLPRRPIDPNLYQNPEAHRVSVIHPKNGEFEKAGFAPLAKPAERKPVFVPLTPKGLENVTKSTAKPASVSSSTPTPLGSRR